MSRNWKNVVIGTSLSAASDATVRVGVDIARALGASPWLIHSSPPPVFVDYLGVSGIVWLESQEPRLRAELAAQADRTGLSALADTGPEHVHLAYGSPPRDIVALAERVEADLIVLGAAEEESALSRFLLGSTTDWVVRKAPCPVLVIRSAAAFPPSRIEFPVDLSAPAASALAQGVDLLARLGVPLAEAEALLVLHPFEVGALFHFTPDQVKRLADQELRRFVSSHCPDAAPALCRIRTGATEEEIVAVLEDRKADLAVLGTHGYGGFERFTIGSVATGILHQASCNLLIVPPGARLAEEETDRTPRGADWAYVADSERDPMAADA